MLFSKDKDKDSQPKKRSTLGFLFNPDIGRDVRPLAETTGEQWRRAIDVEVHGFFNAARGIIPHMREAGGGSLVHLGSAGHLRWPGQGVAMDEAELKARLNALSQEHRDLDAAIEALARSATADMLQIARLKKRKLRLKDEIALIQDLLIPDIIA